MRLMRIIATPCLLIAASFGSILLADMLSRPKKLRDKTTEISLESILSRQGYTRIVLQHEDGGHLRLKVSIDGRDAELFLDTAASGTYVDMDQARTDGIDLHWDATWWAPPTTLPNGVWGKNYSYVKSFGIGGIVLTDHLVKSYDMQVTNKYLRNKGSRPVDGLLGGDVLRRCGAIIDYPNTCLYLKQPNSK